MPIVYIKGDLFDSELFYKSNNVLIIHICNNIGKWGLGFVLEISKRRKEPEIMYKSLKKYELGSTQFVKLENTNITIANMIAQNGVNSRYYKICRVDYFELEQCLKKVNIYALENNCSILMPKIGSGLACGNWNIIENIIKTTLDDKHQIYVYSFE